ncbi:MAG TPA: NAD(P)/FAD-dependent oxidoreductase [Pseudonocardiaceae bacterium]|nr:NAD(P)/FAD-dependent oxidoreductase [Pseudonocardiaceae bacterium]
MSEIVVVGAGPAGMAAARAAAEAGARVVLIDSATKLGGQYHRQDATSDTEAFTLPVGVEHLARTVVFAVEPGPRGPRLQLRTGRADGPGRAARVLEPAALVLATGAHDRALPFPGWDLPGVYTAGAAQALAKGQRTAVGDTVLLAGTGPFLLPVARSLIGVGARLRGVLDANDPIAGWLARPRGLLAGIGKTGELAGHLATLARHRVPYRPRSTVLAAHGRDRVESVTTARLDRDWSVLPGTRQRVEVDAVCVGFGFAPRIELAVALGCALTDGFVAVDLAQTTSVPGVFAAGELTGIGGAALAEDEGRIAGAAAARLLGLPVTVPHRALRRVRSGRRFATALAAAYPIRAGWQGWLDADTVVCRCEEVVLGELRAAVTARAASGVRSVKLVSRAGLGLCQGRICGANVAELVGIAGGATAFARRPIAEPLRLGELADTPRQVTPRQVKENKQ